MFNLHNTETAKKWVSFLSIVALIAILGWIIVYFLLPFDLFGKLAWLLVGAGVIYRILALLVHGLKKSRRSNFGKLFLLAILLGVGRWRLGSPQALSLLWQTVQAPKNSWQSLDTTMLSWTTILSWTTTEESLATWATAPTMTTGQSVSGTIAGTPTIGETVQEKPTLPTWPLSFAYVVPAIVEKFYLPTNGANVTFTNISRTNALYPAFKAWYHKKFFGTNINPNTIVSCNVYFVMLWLAQNWNPAYNATNVFSVFAKEAVARGQTYGCQPGGNVTAANLPK